jgi:protein disulfide-isomerase A1
MDLFFLFISFSSCRFSSHYVVVHFLFLVMLPAAYIIVPLIHTFTSSLRGSFLCSLRYVRRHILLLGRFCRSSHISLSVMQFEKAAHELAAEGLHVATVDATANEALARRFDISGFPTIKWFSSATAAPSDYKGGRDKESIVQWVRRKSGPAATVVTTKEEADSLLERADVVVVGFFETKGSPADLAFNAAASNVEDLVFGVVYGIDGDAAELRKDFGVSQGDAVVAANDFEGEDDAILLDETVFTNAAALADWIIAHSLPVVVTFSQETAPRIFKGDIKTHFLLFADKAAGDASSSALKAFATAAQVRVQLPRHYMS